MRIYLVMILAGIVVFPKFSVSLTRIETERHIYSLHLRPDYLIIGTKGKFYQERTIQLPGPGKSLAHLNSLLCVLHLSNPIVYFITLGKIMDVGSVVLPSVSSDICIIGGHLYVTHPSTNTVSIYDVETRNLIKTLDVGHKPTKLAVYESEVWILNENSRSISNYNYKTQKLLDPVVLYGRPIDVLFVPPMAYVYTVEAPIGVEVIDLKARKPVMRASSNQGGNVLALEDGYISVNHIRLLFQFPSPKMFKRMPVVSFFYPYAESCSGALDVGKICPNVEYKIDTGDFKELLSHLKGAARLFKNELYTLIGTDHALMLIALLNESNYRVSVDWVVFRKDLFHRLCLRLWMSQLESAKRLVIQLLLIDDPYTKHLVGKAYREGIWGSPRNADFANFYLQNGN